MQKEALNRAKCQIAPGAQKEQEMIMKETKKTTEESVIPFWDKIKSLWTTSTDATAGATGMSSTPPSQSPPPQRQQMNVWQNNKM